MFKILIYCGLCNVLLLKQTSHCHACFMTMTILQIMDIKGLAVTVFRLGIESHALTGNRYRPAHLHSGKQAFCCEVFILAHQVERVLLRHFGVGTRRLVSAVLPCCTTTGGPTCLQLERPHLVSCGKPIVCTLQRELGEMRHLLAVEGVEAGSECASVMCQGAFDLPGGKFSLNSPSQVSTDGQHAVVTFPHQAVVIVAGVPTAGLHRRSARRCHVLPSGGRHSSGCR